MPLVWLVVTLVVSALVMTVLVVLAEVLLHYLPWSRLIGHPVPPPPWSYVAGMLPILVAYSIWVLLMGVLLELANGVAYALVGAVVMVLVLWIMVAAGGLAVILSYAADVALGRRMERHVDQASE